DLRRAEQRQAQGPHALRGARELAAAHEQLALALHEQRADVGGRPAPAPDAAPRRRPVAGAVAAHAETRPADAPPAVQAPLPRVAGLRVDLHGRAAGIPRRRGATNPERPRPTTRCETLDPPSPSSRSRSRALSPRAEPGSRS